jgi:hypothetical protein
MHDKAKTSPIGAASGASEELPYLIELWHADKRAGVEKLLARALSAELARAIFRAAQVEHPERRITLRKESRIVADSSDTQ